MGWPGECLNSSGVFHETESGWIGVQGPNVEFVIISTWGQLLLIERPFETADLLFVSYHFIDSFVSSQISDENVLVTRTTGYDIQVVPGKRADPSGMSFIGVE